MSKKSDGPESIFIRLAAVGAIAIGGIGMIPTFNAILSGNEIGAAVPPVASASAFGFIINVASRR